MEISGPLHHDPAPGDGVGRTLREAREAAGYSLSDVAARLRLTQSTIEDLEAERFEKFPVPVFTRGYLNNYARLLGVPPEPLLDEFDQRGFVPPRVHPQPEAWASSRSSELTVTLMTVIVVVITLGLGALWWRAQWGEEAGRAPTVGSIVIGDESEGIEGEVSNLDADSPLSRSFEIETLEERDDATAFP